VKRPAKKDRSPAERVEDIPRILEALRLAVREALLRHKQAGNPVAVWRDGRVVWVRPEDLPGERPAAEVVTGSLRILPYEWFNHALAWYNHAIWITSPGYCPRV
jgi:hypothetical protein